MNDSLLEIDAYLNGEMSAEEMQVFEKKAASDTVLAEELRLQKDMRMIYDDKQWVDGNEEVLKNEKSKQLKSFFTSEEAASIKNTISEVISENRPEPLNNKTFWWIGIAASIAVIIAISTFVFRNNNKDDLYSQYIQVEKIPSLVTRGEEKDQLLQEAQLLFEDQKYKEAVHSFIQYQSDADIINPLSYIYTGISYLELNEFEKALNQFNLLSISNTLHSKKAEWYKAMVFLKQKKKSELISVLKTILSNENNYKYQEADELLEKINE